ncbi:DUF4124 domain-containing protein [Bacterioplanoides sp.]|uniref:DUF4124 domain-containing protein n=1 Tax=Bacterioplanoides sp. TaxID=2066072 RepID=UPI003B5CC6D1
MRLMLIPLIFSLLGVSAWVQAEKVYRWTDENGQVHFSSQPPRGLNEDVYKFRVDKAADAPPPKPVDVSAETNKTAIKAKAAEQQPEIDPKEAKKYCQQARDAKVKLSENFNRRYKQKDGSVRPLTDKERADMMKQANESIAAYCK